MPPDMLLRSDWDHTNLSAPGRAGTLEAWVRSGEAERLEPLPLAHFLDYADWFQRSSCPRATRATLRRIALADGGVRVTTSAGDEVQARAAVLALGVTPFPRVPGALAASGDPRIRIVLERSGYDDLAGKRVAVIGAGNNGVESALLALRARGCERRAHRALARALVRRARAAHAARRPAPAPLPHRLSRRGLRAAADQPLRAPPRRVRAPAARAAHAPQRAPAATGRRALAARATSTA